MAQYGIYFTATDAQVGNVVNPKISCFSNRQQLYSIYQSFFLSFLERMEIPQYLSLALGSKIPGVSTNSCSISKTYFFINIHIQIACMVINFYGPFYQHFLYHKKGVVFSLHNSGQGSMLR